jgi:O-antigen/teichoic acid export membrane protein
LLFLGSLFPVLNFSIPTAYFNNFYCAYFVFSFVLTFLANTHYALFAGRSRFLAMNGIEFGVTCLKVLCFSFLYFRRDVFPLSIKAIFLLDLFFLAIQFALLFGIGKFSFDFKSDFKVDWKNHLFPLFKYIMPLYWTALIAFLYTRVDFWIVERMRGLSELGAYSIAIGAAQLLTFFPAAINSVLYTYLAKSSGSERNNIFAVLSKVNLIFVVLGAIFLSLASDWLIPLVYGANFANATSPLKILVWGYTFASIKFLFIIYNQVSLKLKDNVISELTVLVISILLTALLVPSMGIIGASISTVAANFLALAFLLVRIQGQSSLHLTSCFVITSSDLRNLLGLSNKSAEYPPAAD